MPCKLTFDLLTLKVVSESHVTWATSVPILVLGLSVLDLGPIYATDRQTSVAHHRLMPPTIWAGAQQPSGTVLVLVLLVDLLYLSHHCSSFINDSSWSFTAAYLRFLFWNCTLTRPFSSFCSCFPVLSHALMLPMLLLVISDSPLRQNTVVYVFLSSASAYLSVRINSGLVSWFFFCLYFWIFQASAKSTCVQLRDWNCDS